MTTKFKELNISYPINFYDFSCGVNISEYEIDKWVKDGLNRISEKINNNPDLTETFSSISSGNTKVFIEAYLSKTSPKWYLKISVTQNYKTLTVDLEN